MRGRGCSQPGAKEFDSAVRDRMPAVIQDLNPGIGYAERNLDRHQQLGGSERLDGALQTDLDPRLDRQAITLCQSGELGHSESAVRSRRRCITECSVRRQRCECRLCARQIGGGDAIPVAEQRQASGQEQGRKGHCEIWLTCWYISSAAFTTLELAS